MSPRGVAGLRIIGNTSTPGPLPVKIHPSCTGVGIEGNTP
jgi:hypothetical protein